MVVVIDALLHSQTSAAGVKFYSENKTQTCCIKDQIPEPALFSEIRECKSTVGRAAQMFHMASADLPLLCGEVRIARSVRFPLSRPLV